MSSKIAHNKFVYSNGIVIIHLQELGQGGVDKLIFLLHFLSIYVHSCNDAGLERIVFVNVVIDTIYITISCIVYYFYSAYHPTALYITYDNSV